MAEVPYPWRSYERQQKYLAQRTQVDDKAWGLEAGLNLIVATDPAASPASEIEIDRRVSSRTRLERYRSGRRDPFPDDDELPDPKWAAGTIEASVAAREILQRIENAAANSELEILLEVVAGHGYAEIAVRRGTTPGALRVRVVRLRRFLMALAA